MAYEESCETCAWMNELEFGPHCANCIHAYTSEYQPISNRGILRLKTNEELANIMMIDKPYCDPIMGDMVCGTPGGCAECLKTWLDDTVDQEKEVCDAEVPRPASRE